jgi:hypothetical protein
VPAVATATAAAPARRWCVSNWPTRLVATSFAAAHELLAPVAGAKMAKHVVSGASYRGAGL